MHGDNPGQLVFFCLYRIFSSPGLVHRGQLWECAASMIDGKRVIVEMFAELRDLMLLKSFTAAITRALDVMQRTWL